jgi:hypothetical protein
MRLDGKSDFKRRSLPEKPHFVKVAGKGWDDWRWCSIRYSSVDLLRRGNSGA